MTADSRRRGRHPIRVVAQRTGLRPDVLRVWERRYGAVKPERSPTNRRYYSDREVEKLILLRRATLLGRRVGQVARLDLEELRALVAEDQAALCRAPAPPGQPAPALAGEHFSACLRAIARLDAEALRRRLERAEADLTRPLLVDYLLVPLMRQIGKRWEAGELRVVHEHVASAVIRTFLGDWEAAPGHNSGGPCLVAGTPQGQLHEMGALLAASTAASEGWQAVYLGPSLPDDEIAAAARQLGARVVALSLIHPRDDVRWGGMLKRLRRLLSEETRIIIGGTAAPASGEIPKEASALALPDMPAFRAELRRITARQAES